jgi:hypothetical protein
MMKQRCFNPNNEAFNDYGGRGIIVHPRWIDSFENFISDLGPRPSPEHTLERGDVNGNYDKSNCYWATMQEQQNNKRNNVVLQHNGESKTIAEWVRDKNVNYSAIRKRLESGWSVHDALETRIREHKKRIT